MASDETQESAYSRGHVVWHDGLFRQSGRPWLVVSTDAHPFHGEEYVVAGLTTTERSEAVELTEEAWAVGGLPRTSYVSPWFLTTLKHADIERGVGEITEDTAKEILQEVRSYLQ